MAIQFNCPECAALLSADEGMIGRDIRCGRCEAVFPVPEPRGAHPAEAPPSLDDDEPRPRRRRRRPPPPPPGRSPLFWVALVFGVLLLGGCACCGGGYLLLPGERWERYESPAGGFAVDMPVKANPNLRIPGMPADPNLKVEAGVLWKRGEVYAVIYADILPRNMRANNDEALLDEVVRGVESDPDFRRMVRNEKITVSGFPARELEYVATDGGTYVARAIIADRRLYMLIGGGRFVGPGNANVRRFLDSFEVTDETLDGGVAFNKRKAEDGARREAERVAAAEKAAREAAHRAKENEAFRTAPYTGPAPGDSRALSLLPGDVMHLALEEGDPSGVGEWKRTRPLVWNSTHGVGVRGKAAFLTTGTRSQEATIYNDAATPGPQGRKGFTFSGWYKARHRSFDLFNISTHDGSSTARVYMRLSIEDKSIIARSQGQRNGSEKMEIAAPRPADGKWHHVAVVFDQTGRDMLVSVYLDGEKAAEGVGQRTTLGYSRLHVGSPQQQGADWHLLTDSEGKPAAAAADDLIGAIDECSVIDGPLTVADVRKLAGRDPMSTRTFKRYGPKFATPFEVPDPTRIAGLRNYYSFEEPDPLAARDAVGGQAPLKARDAEFIQGPRGRALRATGGPPVGHAIGFSEGSRYTATGIGFAEGTAFTLAFWVRLDDDMPGPAYLLYTQGQPADVSNYRRVLLSRDRKTGDLDFRISVGPTDELAVTRPGGKPSEWAHVALSRDKAGTFRIAVNGSAAVVDGKFAKSIPINSFLLGLDIARQGAPVYSVEFDELCIFDRALADDELAALAGRTALPKK